MNVIINGIRLAIVTILLAASGAAAARCPSIPDSYGKQARADVRAAREWGQGKRQELQARGRDEAPGQRKRAAEQAARDIAAVCRGSLRECRQVLRPSADRGDLVQVSPECTEQTVVLAGTVMRAVLDLEDGTSMERFAFLTETGEELALFSELGVEPGKATVAGQRLGDDLYVFDPRQAPELAGAVLQTAEAATGLPAWAIDLGLSTLRRSSVGPSKILHVMVSDTNATYPYTRDQTWTQISEPVQRAYREQSWGKDQTTVELFPAVVTLNESLSCSPWTAAQQVRDKIDGQQNYLGFTEQAIFAQFLHCGYCGVSYIDALGTFVTNDGTINGFATNQSRTSCTANRCTAQHECGHSKGIVHGGLLRPRNGTWGLLDAFRTMEEETWTYLNRNDWQGASTDCGEWTATSKGVVRWLDEPGRTVWPAQVGKYLLRPTSSPDGLVLLGYKRGAQRGVSIEFRQKGSTWESHVSGTSAKQAKWNQCVYVVDTGGSGYLNTNIRTRSMTDDGCVPVGEVQRDEWTLAEFVVRRISIDTADPNKSFAEVEFTKAPTRVDTAEPMVRLSGFEIGAQLSGTVPVTAEAWDEDGNLVGIEWSLNDGLENKTTVLRKDVLPAMSAQATRIFDLDTSTLQSGRTYSIQARAADAVRRGSRTTFLSFTVGTGGTTTTTSTVTTSTVTTTTITTSTTATSTTSSTTTSTTATSTTSSTTSTTVPPVRPIACVEPTEQQVPAGVVATVDARCSTVPPGGDPITHLAVFWGDGSSLSCPIGDGSTECGLFRHQFADVGMFTVRTYAGNVINGRFEWAGPAAAQVQVTEPTTTTTSSSSTTTVTTPPFACCLPHGCETLREAECEEAGGRFKPWVGCWESPCGTSTTTLPPRVIQMPVPRVGDVWEWVE